ncbi:MAG: hypothetical protein Kow0092_13400 [Deferrisomatales bacterium]
MTVEGDARLLARALMSNHFHLVLRPRRAYLEDLMRRPMTGYAGGNRKHGRAGRNPWNGQFARWTRSWRTWRRSTGGTGGDPWLESARQVSRARRGFCRRAYEPTDATMAESTRRTGRTQPAVW